MASTPDSARAPIILNAFNMASVGHINHGLWTHPRDQSSHYHRLDYWTGLAKELERGLFADRHADRMMAAWLAGDVEPPAGEDLGKLLGRPLAKGGVKPPEHRAARGPRGPDLPLGSLLL